MHAVWIGLPQTADAAQTRRYRVINSVAAEARRRPAAATYVDTFSLLAGPSGGYAQYVEDARGRPIRVRAADGVHFEREGGDVVARGVIGALERKFDLTSWKKTKRETRSPANLGG